MRKKMLCIAILCLSAAWLMAQEPTSSGAQAGSSGQSATQSAPSQSASPSAQSPSQSTPDAGAAAPSGQSGAATQSSPNSGAAAGQGSGASIMEGCLGGSQPNYTLTDKNGTTYKLVAPPNADVSILAKHIGEPIAVMGTVNNAGSSSAASSGSVAGGAGTSASSSSQPSIQVQKIGRGTGQCPASSGAAAPKGPASKQ